MIISRMESDFYPLYSYTRYKALILLRFVAKSVAEHDKNFYLNILTSYGYILFRM